MDLPGSLRFRCFCIIADVLCKVKRSFEREMLAFTQMGQTKNPPVVGPTDFPFLGAVQSCSESDQSSFAIMVNASARVICAEARSVLS